MRMFDALNQPQKPFTAGSRASFGLAPFALGAFVVVSLGAALPAANAPQDQGTAVVDVLTGGKHAKETRTLLENMDAWLVLSKDLKGVSTANEKIVSVPKETVLARQVRIVAGTVGRTTVTLSYADGTTEQLVVLVRRELAVLQAALKDINPAIEVDVAPDRDAVILTGVVLDEVQYSRAEKAAGAYVSAGARGQDDTKSKPGSVVNLLRVTQKATSLEQRLQPEFDLLGAKGVTLRRIQQGPMPDDTKDTFVLSGAVPNMQAMQHATQLVKAAVGDQSSRVVSQLSTDDRPSAIEEVIERAIRDQVHCPKVKVSRVAAIDVSGDMDVLVLTGTVPNQTALVRALTLASKVFQQQEIVKKKRNNEVQRVTETFAGGLTRTTETPLNVQDSSKDIHVAADESGALRQNGATSQSTGSALRGVFSSGGQNSSASAGGGEFGSLLDNKLDQNIARAKAVELAEGRILSFLTVEDLPQVRVDIKLYEINRSALLKWDSNLNKAGVADFDTNGINPNRVSRNADGAIQTNANGDPILDHTGTDVSNVVSFLEGGFGNSLKIGGGRFALDAAFTLLETEGIARSLASPSLTVLSGELAAFGDGGSVSVRSSVTTNVGINDASVGVFSSVEKLSFGIQLAIRPLVDEKGYITLDVLPSVSNPDFELTQLVRTSTGTPQETVAFAERSLRTSARLRDGETLLIGGLSDTSRTDKSGQTPGLAQIPLLGWLFHDKSFEDKDRELVIAVNPVILRDSPKEARLWAYPDSAELLARPAKNAEKPAEKPTEKSSEQAQTATSGTKQ